MKTSMTSQQAITLYCTIEALMHKFDEDNQKLEPKPSQAAEIIRQCHDMSENLGRQIEKCGASTELTLASLMCSALTATLNELTYAKTKPS